MLSVSLDPATGYAITDHGLLVDQDGRRVWRAPGMMSDGQNKVFIIGDWWTIPGDVGTFRYNYNGGAEIYEPLPRGQFFVVVDVDGQEGQHGGDTLGVAADDRPRQSAVLTWTSLDGTYASIDQGIGTVTTNGSVQVWPTASTRYTLTVEGQGGNTTTRSATVSVRQPVSLTWTNPAGIIYGAPLGAAQLNATASVAGAFLYSRPAGTILNAGAGQTLSVTFQPSDSQIYMAASASVTIDVARATPVLNWPTPGSIVYGMPFGGTQLNATTDVPGSRTYSPQAGTVLNASAGHTLHVDFVPTDSANYTAASRDVTIVVTRATPALTWAPPPAIPRWHAFECHPAQRYRAATRHVHLHAAVGYVLNVGGHTLHATFVPTDSANYTTASTAVTHRRYFGCYLPRGRHNHTGKLDQRLRHAGLQPGNRRDERSRLCGPDTGRRVAVHLE